MTQNFDANSTNAKSFVLPNEHTSGRTDEWKDENYIPLGINVVGIKITYNDLNAFLIVASDTNKGGLVVFNVASRLQIPLEKKKTRYAGLPRTQGRLNGSEE